MVAIDGATVSGENHRLDFGEQGQLSGQAGCNRFSGTYAESGRTLRPGPVIATRMACPGPRMTHERRVLVLGGR
ncbi:MAG: META domain-containing protein [Sphingomonadaceae bacterium]|nr:META domain-containing protein [Sphingomonadaceae bacterium]